MAVSTRDPQGRSQDADRESVSCPEEVPVIPTLNMSEVTEKQVTCIFETVPTEKGLSVFRKHFLLTQ